MGKKAMSDLRRLRLVRLGVYREGNPSSREVQVDLDNDRDVDHTTEKGCIVIDDGGGRG